MPGPQPPSIATVLSQTVELTNTEIKALPTTPVVVVPAVAGKIICPLGGNLLSVMTTAYTNVSSNNGFVRLTISGGDVMIGPVSDGSLDDFSALFGAYGAGFLTVSSALLPINKIGFSGQGAYPSALAGDGPPTSDLLIAVANGGDATGDFTGGDDANRLTVVVIYTLIDAS